MSNSKLFTIAACLVLSSPIALAQSSEMSCRYSLQTGILPNPIDPNTPTTVTVYLTYEGEPNMPNYEPFNCAVDYYTFESDITIQPIGLSLGKLTSSLQNERPTRGFRFKGSSSFKIQGLPAGNYTIQASSPAFLDKKPYNATLRVQKKSEDGKNSAVKNILTSVIPLLLD